LASKVRLPRLRVRRTGNWIEVYTERTGIYRYSYVLGLVPKDGHFIITDVFLDPKLRGKGLGKKMVARAIRESGASRVEAHDILEEAQGFWEALGIKGIEERGKFNKVSRKRSSFLEGEWFFE
jgi:GNAT superfamily N-acetyltransferase